MGTGRFWDRKWVKERILTEQRTRKKNVSEERKQRKSIIKKINSQI
jgi:hypothetical protein